MAKNLSDTRPNKRVRLEATRPAAPSPRRPEAPPNNPTAPESKAQGAGCLGGFFRSPVVLVTLMVLLGLFLVTSASAAVGWSVGSGEFAATQTFEAALYMLDQYNLALGEIQSGDLSLARQRLEYIYSQNPDFLDVREQLVTLLVSMGVSLEPTSAAPTATPTVDPRPKEELFTAAQGHINASQWTDAINTLLSLRKTDPAYRTADVDGWLFIALRNRGVENIIQLGLFEPGLYDFALAEEFGPLDNEASVLREGARYFLYGNAFWVAYPQDAAYYYGLSMSIAPGLRDSTGLSAFARYWQSLVDWADQLAASGDWCDAYDQYQAAQRARTDGNLQPTADFAYVQCIGPSDTPTNIPSATWTVAITFTPSPGPTATPSLTPTPGPTNTPSETPIPSDTPMPSDTPVPSDTPSETPTP